MSTSKDETTANPRGIPAFPFLPTPQDYIKDSSVEATLGRFQEMISKYNFMSSNVERRAAGLREKLPEMRKSLDTVKFLKLQHQQSHSTSKADPDGTEEEDADVDDLGDENGKKSSETLDVTFPLQDTLYAHATIDTTTLDSVYLWLGANVMVAYPLDEAETMLAEKLDKAKQSLKSAEEDLEFIRAQTTTLEVATARVHNWDVAEKRRLKELGGKDQGKIKSKDEDEDEKD